MVTVWVIMSYQQIDQNPSALLIILVAISFCSFLLQSPNQAAGWDLISPYQSTRLFALSCLMRFYCASIIR
jgi:hypothetical protein